MRYGGSKPDCARIVCLPPVRCSTKFSACIKARQLAASFQQEDLRGGLKSGGRALQLRRPAGVSIMFVLFRVSRTVRSKRHSSAHSAPKTLRKSMPYTVSDARMSTNRLTDGLRITMRWTGSSWDSTGRARAAGCPDRAWRRSAAVAGGSASGVPQMWPISCCPRASSAPTGRV